MVKRRENYVWRTENGSTVGNEEYQPKEGRKTGVFFLESYAKKHFAEVDIRKRISCSSRHLKERFTKADTSKDVLLKQSCKKTHDTKKDPRDGGWPWMVLVCLTFIYVHPLWWLHRKNTKKLPVVVWWLLAISALRLIDSDVSWYRLTWYFAEARPIVDTWCLEGV